MTDEPILICYDGSQGASRAIEAAAGLFGSRRAVVLTVGPPLTGPESYLVASSAAPGADFEQLNNVEALARASEGAERATRAGLVADARSSLLAPAWEGIVDVADEVDAAVIVVGSRGYSGARELFEGSTSHQVALHAGRPVLIVPPARGDQ